MRDLIWTIILIWFAWQVVNIFRSAGSKKQHSRVADPIQTPPAHPASDRQKKLDTEGEYVDFEEVK